MIAIDGKFTAVPATGVQRYAAEISSRLLTSYPRRYRLFQPSWAATGARTHGLLSLVVRGLNNIWEQVWLPFTTRVENCELVYCPANVAPRFARAAVVVIHDIIALRHPEWYSRAFARWTSVMVPRAAKQAKWVITDSHTSGAALLSLFPFLDGRISVVYPGISDRFQATTQDQMDQIRRRYAIDRPYLIFVGALDPRKNISRILGAWSIVASRIPDVQLVMVGMSSGVFRGSAEAGREVAHAPGVRWLGYVPESDLPALLTGSMGLVYPSLDEGFGFPPLEAMACGRPAIVSRQGSLVEVCGDAAVYVDAYDEESIAHAMTTVLENGSSLSPLRHAGRERASQFNWDTAAAATNAILMRVLDGT